MELSQNNLYFYTGLLNVFCTAYSSHICRYSPYKQLENQIKIFGENSLLYFVPVPMSFIYDEMLFRVAQRAYSLWQTGQNEILPDSLSVVPSFLSLPTFIKLLSG
jgi:hypothetical protein